MIYRQGLVVGVRPDRSILTSAPRPGKRGVIRGMSPSSRRRLRRYLGRIRQRRFLFITLTSRRDVNYAHVRAMAKTFWRHYGLCPIVWRMELTRAGVVHVHMLVYTRVWVSMPWVSRVWSRIIGHESHPQVDYIDGYSAPRVVAYICKYASKSPRGDGGGLDNTTIISGRRWWGVLRAELLEYAPLEVLQALPASVRPMYDSFRVYCRQRGWQFRGWWALAPPG